MHIRGFSPINSGSQLSLSLLLSANAITTSFLSLHSVSVMPLSAVPTAERQEDMGFSDG